MNHSELPITAFVDPHGRNAEQVGSIAHHVLNLILTRMSSAAQRSPLPASNFVSSIAALPDHPSSESQLLIQIDQLITQSMNPAHPGYIGHMDSMPTTMSVLGDLVAAAINNNMLSLEMSPLLSRLEQALVKEMALLFGLGDRAGGVMVSGGSLANLEAIAVARNQAFQSREWGITRLSAPPVLFASEVAHASIQKAAMLLGLGTSAVMSVPVTANSQMCPDALRSGIEEAKADGLAPFCVVATAGTTVTGNIDPLPAIHQICRDYGLWFHVDAAYGGALMFSEIHRDRLSGIAQADSITFNPQKWLYIAKTSAMVLFKNAEVLYRQFRIGAPYMADTDGFINLGEISVQGTRHADVIKLWLSLQHLGKRAYAQLIEESDRLINQVVSNIKSRSFLQLASQPEMNIVCFRGTPSWLSECEWDQWNMSLQAHLLATENLFLSLPLYRGARWLRMVILNPYTDTAILQRVFSGIDSFIEQSSLEQTT